MNTKQLQLGSVSQDKQYIYTNGKEYVHMRYSRPAGRYLVCVFCSWHKNYRDK